MLTGSMSIVKSSSVKIEDALLAVPAIFRDKLIKEYIGLKNAYSKSSFDTCGIKAGKFCEIFLRWLQYELKGRGNYIPFSTRIGNFTDECKVLERLPKTVGHESTRVLIPRALNFMYTIRNKRGIGHVGGDVDENRIDAYVVMAVADWCIAELIRLKYSVSLEEAQSICDAVITRQTPQIWEISGKKRVLTPGLSYSKQTLMLLYSSADFAIPVEDLFAWIEHKNLSNYKRDVLRPLHSARLIEYDKETEMISISPSGIKNIEIMLLG